ncbi:hypothetical protein LX69_01926 [Breznakibacter xylanolyticus]|uniref:Uncharacterized protein n=1 Tax=Breznakibacter xylanolyticus TaxID=990 RepID=A0A2W7N8D6_9BACT|nr:hypothetical protein LX69_01926 [Breznakibacter xylanolyticus]
MGLLCEKNFMSRYLMCLLYSTFELYTFMFKPKPNQRLSASAFISYTVIL